MANKTQPLLKLINVDMRPRQERRDRTIAIIGAVKKLIVAALVTTTFAFVEHLAEADSQPEPQNITGAVTDNLMSDDMAEYIAAHQHGHILTEYDMQ